MWSQEFFTQDIDILPDAANETVDAGMDIMPDVPMDAPIEEAPIAPEMPINPELDAELAAILEWINTSGQEVTENLDTIWEWIEWTLEKVEEAQKDPENSESILKEIYQDLLTTETALQATEVARDVAQAKVSELQAQVTGMEIDLAGNYQTDNPDLMIINKLLGAVQAWDEWASGKVKAAINKLNLSLFNTSIEDGQVQDNLESLDIPGLSLNEWTLPTGEIRTPDEEVDINDITAILA